MRCSGKPAVRHETQSGATNIGDIGRWSNAPSPGWLRGNRKVRYRGVAKNDHWLHHRAAALNLRRLIGLGLIHNGGAWALA
jgi:IS5 family transposase